MAEPWEPGDLVAPVWDLAPASEVRRRGQVRARRRRARRTTLAALATAVVVGVPAALAASGGGGSVVVAGDTSTPTSSPTSTSSTAAPGGWRTTVPAGLDLAAGMSTAHGAPVVSRPGRGPAVRDPASCGAARWAQGLPAGATDLLLAVGPDAGGTSERRTLVLYPDARAAGAAYDAARGAGATCSAGEAGTEVAVTDDVAGPGADQSWGYVVTGTGTESHTVVRTGNAVLVEHATSADRLAPGALDGWLRDRVAPVVRELCAFAEESC